MILFHRNTWLYAAVSHNEVFLSLRKWLFSEPVCTAVCEVASVNTTERRLFPTSEPFTRCLLSAGCEFSSTSKTEEMKVLLFTFSRSSSPGLEVCSHCWCPDAWEEERAIPDSTAKAFQPEDCSSQNADPGLLVSAPLACVFLMGTVHCRRLSSCTWLSPREVQGRDSPAAQGWSQQGCGRNSELLERDSPFQGTVTESVLPSCVVVKCP